MAQAAGEYKAVQAGALSALRTLRNDFSSARSVPRKQGRRLKR